MPIWRIACKIDDRVAITIGRTVATGGDDASDEACRMAFAAALPQFMARAVAARFAAALSDRAAARANDLASAIVVDYPDGYNPQVAPVQLRTPPGSNPDLSTGPQADPVYWQRLLTDAQLSGMGMLDITVTDVTAGPTDAALGGDGELTADVTAGPPTG